MKKIAFLFSLIIISYFSYAQTPTPKGWVDMIHNGDDYKTITALYDNYYQDTAKQKKEFAFQHYLRWKMFWKNRVYSSAADLAAGKLGLFQQTTATAADLLFPPPNSTIGGQTICSSSSANNPHSNWEEWGFDEFPYSNWPPNTQFKTGAGMGIITAVAIDPNDTTNQTMYAGSPSAGVWKTTNGGDMWFPLMDDLLVPGLSIDDIAVNPKNGNNLLAATGQRLWRQGLPGIGVLQSHDGGQSWQATDLLFQGVHQPSKNFVRKVAFHPKDTNKLYAALDGQLRLSIDQGFSWDSVVYNNTGQFIYQFKFHPTNPDTLYLSTFPHKDSTHLTAKIMRSYNGGQSWTEIQNNIGHSFTAQFFDFAVSPQTPDYIYATAQSHNSRGWLFKSRNNGNTWSITSTPFTANKLKWNTPFKGIIEVSPTDSNLIITGGIKLHISTNGGVTFIQSQGKVHDDMRASTSASGLLVLGTDGGVSTSADAAATNWEAKYTGLNITEFWGHDVDDSYSYLIGGCQDVGINRYDIKKKEWLYVTEFPYGDGSQPMISKHNPQQSFVTVFTGQQGQNHFVHSTDGGYNYRHTEDPNEFLGINEHHLEHRPLDQDKDGYIYTGYTNVYKRHMDSLVWHPLSDFTGSAHNKNIFNGLSALAVSKSTDVMVAAYSNPTWNFADNGDSCHFLNTCDIKKLYVTTDGGTTWIDRSQGLFTPMVFNAISDVIISPTNENHIWVTFGQYVNGQRVYFSSDAGQTWTNQSYDLKPVPINKIVYQPNSNDRLFVATDVGVFTKEGSETTWECYNAKLPTVPCMDLDINECANMLTVSTYGRGVFESPLPPVPFNTNGFDTISGTVEWNGTRQFYKDIYVDGELTIKGLVKMAQGKGIVVSPTSILTIDGGEINSFKTCNDTTDWFWKGIELVGDYTKSHHWQSVAAYHAKLVMKNGATIKNARHGVMQWRAGQYHTAGSLIEIENSSFINCHKGIEFIHHTQVDESFIKNTDFLIDNNYYDIDRDTLKAIPQITLWSVRGVQIIDCNFENNSSYHIFDEEKQYRDNAIFSIDAGYEVVSDCQENKSRDECNFNNTFKNFSYGVHAVGTGSANTVTVDRAVFTNNAIGASFEGIKNVRFTRNLVKTGDTLILNYPTRKGDYRNLEMIGATGYRIEHNDFESKAMPVHEVTSVYLKNSGVDHNESYYNSFKYEIIAQHYHGVNRHPNNHQGFQGICNWHPNSSVDGDIFIDKDGGQHPAKIQGIRFHQGSPTKHLDNIWSTTANPVEGHIKNDGNMIRYYYKKNNDKPIYFTPIQVDTQHVANAVNACPRLIYEEDKINGDDNSIVLNDFDLKKTNYDSLLFLYLGTIDGGNADSMLQTMNLNSNPSAVQLRDQLIAQSPYVSTSSLMQVAESDALGDLFLLEVCLANPDATQSEGFLDYVEFEIPNPLSASSVQLIYNNWDTETGRTLMEQDLAGLNAEAGRLFNWLMHYYKTDYDNDRYADIVALYEKWPSFEHKCKLIELAMERNDYIETTNLFEDITNNMDLVDYQQDELNQLQEYVNIREGFFNTGRTIWEATPEEVSDLKNIADNYTGRSSTLAYNIICYIYGDCSEQSQLRKKAPRKRVYYTNDAVVDIEDKVEAKVKVHPNPASEKLMIDILGNAAANYQLELIDHLGRTALKSRLNASTNKIDVAALKNGSYLLRIFQDGKAIESKSIIVQHQ